MTVEMEASYLKSHVGSCLSMCLAEVAEKRPADPIEFISQWLYKYEANQKYMREKEAEIVRLKKEKEEHEQERKMKEEMKKEAARIRKEEEEKRRKEEELKEAESSSASKLATVVEKVEEPVDSLEEPAEHTEGISAENLTESHDVAGDDPVSQGEDNAEEPAEEEPEEHAE